MPPQASLGQLVDRLHAPVDAKMVLKHMDLVLPVHSHIFTLKMKHLSPLSTIKRVAQEEGLLDLDSKEEEGQVEERFLGEVQQVREVVRIRVLVVAHMPHEVISIEIPIEGVGEIGKRSTNQLL